MAISLYPVPHDLGASVPLIRSSGTSLPFVFCHQSVCSTSRILMGLCCSKRRQDRLFSCFSCGSACIVDKGFYGQQQEFKTMNINAGENHIQALSIHLRLTSIVDLLACDQVCILEAPEDQIRCVCRSHLPYHGPAIPLSKLSREIDDSHARRRCIVTRMFTLKNY